MESSRDAEGGWAGGRETASEIRVKLSTHPNETRGGSGEGAGSEVGQRLESFVLP